MENEKKIYIPKIIDNRPINTLNVYISEEDAKYLGYPLITPFQSNIAPSDNIKKLKKQKEHFWDNDEKYENN